MCSFTTVLPTETALRVWDALFLRGSDVLFRVALALFHDAKERILSVARSSTTSSVLVCFEVVAPLVYRSEFFCFSVQVAPVAAGSCSPDRTVTGGLGPLISRSDSRGAASVASSPMRGFFSPRDTVAETARRVFAAAAAAGIGASDDASPPPSSPGRNRLESTGRTVAVAPLARGGTTRPAASLFPAIFGLVKALPSSVHDADALLRVSRSYP